MSAYKTLIHPNGRQVRVSEEEARTYSSLGWTEQNETTKKGAEDGAVRKPRRRTPASKAASDDK